MVEIPLRESRNSTIGTAESRLTVAIVGVLALLAAAYTMYLWGRYLTSVDVAGSVGELAGRDYRAFSVAGSLARIADTNSLYDHSAASYVSADAAAFVYPPWFSIAMIPLSFVGFQLGYWIWLATTAVFGALALVVVRRRYGLAAFGLLLVTAAGLQTVLYGQSALLMLGLSAGLAWAIVSKRFLLAGVAVAFMAFKPHLLIGLGVVWFWRWSRFSRSLLAAAITSSVLYVMSELLLPGSLVGWMSTIADTSGDLVAPTAEITLGSAVRLLVGDGLAGSVATWTLVAGGIAWLASVLYRKDLDTGTLLMAAFGMSIAVSLHALLYDVVVVVPAIILIWGARPDVRVKLALYGVSTISLLTIGPIAIAAQMRVFEHAVSVGPVALAVFVVWLVESARPQLDESDAVDRRIPESTGA